MQPRTHVNACILHYLLRFIKLVFHNLTLNQPSKNTSNARYSVSSVIQRASLRKQTFRDAAGGFPAKQRLRNECRNSILMTRHYPDLGNAFDWSCQPIRSTTQISVVMRHQYGISALISQRLFCRETSIGVARCRLFSQATRQRKPMRITKGRSSAHF